MTGICGAVSYTHLDVYKRQDMFLPVMEENGSVVELDRMILREVCVNMRGRLDKGLPVVQTSVNLSRLHIQEWDAAQRLHAIVQEYGIPASLLEFELTETILLDQFTGAQNLCNQLREYGLSLIHIFRTYQFRSM